VTPTMRSSFTPSHLLVTTCVFRYAESAVLRKKNADEVLAPHTQDFWSRVNALFDKIDRMNVPDNRITRDELVTYFRGNTQAADKYGF